MGNWGSSEIIDNYFAAFINVFIRIHCKLNNLIFICIKTVKANNARNYNIVTKRDNIII